MLFNSYLDEWPTLACLCGFELSPETLYEHATVNKIKKNIGGQKSPPSMASN
jgi:hypothetical protein